MRTLYTLLHTFALPFIILRLWLRGRKNPAYRQRWNERFAKIDVFSDQPRIWLHAVSVGEFRAAIPLIRSLLIDFPDHKVLITTTTPTGSKQVMNTFGGQVEHTYFPYDVPWVMQRFLARTKPSLCLVMETEIWPNIFHLCQKNNVPLMMLNARLSERSAKRYKLIKGLAASTLACVNEVHVQDEKTAQRFESLTVTQDRIKLSGNIKFDLKIDQSIIDEGMQIRKNLGDNRPVWIAASTHEGEDDILLDAHKMLCQAVPNAILIIVPRHPERFLDVNSLIWQRYSGSVRRELEQWPSIDDSVYLADTMGELLSLIAAADVAFIGGSLIARGGHNPLEAVFQHKPVISGRHTFNFDVVYQLLQDAGALTTVDNTEQLAKIVMRLLKNKAARDELSDKAIVAVQQHQGAKDAMLKAIEACING